MTLFIFSDIWIKQSNVIEINLVIIIIRKHIKFYCLVHMRIGEFVSMNSRAEDCSAQYSMTNVLHFYTIEFSRIFLRIV